MKLVWKHTMPKTIDELRSFCLQKGMPLEQMRFFIGEACRESCAFGVYQAADGRFVVHKNLSDGSCSIRYTGTSEDVAVRLFTQKIGQEIALRRSADAPKPTISVLGTLGTGANWLIYLAAWLLADSGVYMPDRPNAVREITPIPVEDWEASDWADWESKRTSWDRGWQGR